MSIRIIAEDDGERHTIEIRDDGEMFLYDHDLSAELALVELGFEPSECVKIYLDFKVDPFCSLIRLFMLRKDEDEDGNVAREKLHYEPWSEIILEWIESFTPYVEENLEGNQKVLSHYRKFLSELQRLVANGPEWYFDNKKRQIEIDRMLNETMDAVRRSITFKHRTTANMIDAINFAIDSVFEIPVDIFSLTQNVKDVISYCQEAAAEIAKEEAVREMETTRHLKEFILSGGLEQEKEEARKEEFLSCLRTAIRVLETPDEVML